MWINCDEVLAFGSIPPICFSLGTYGPYPPLGVVPGSVKIDFPKRPADYGARRKHERNVHRQSPIALQVIVSSEDLPGTGREAACTS